MRYTKVLVCDVLVLLGVVEIWLFFEQSNTVMKEHIYMKFRKTLHTAMFSRYIKPEKCYNDYFFQILSLFWCHCTASKQKEQKTNKQRALIYYIDELSFASIAFQSLI
jgi:hypothetical protein